MQRILIMLVTLAFSIGTVALYGPQILVDLTTPTERWSPATELRVTEAKCTAYVLVIDTCTIRWSAPTSGSLEHGSLEYLSLGSIGDRAVLIRDVQDRTRLTITGAPQKLFNRIVMMVIFSGLFLLCFIAVWATGDEADTPETADATRGDPAREASAAPLEAAPSRLPAFTPPSGSVVMRANGAASDAPVFGRRRA